jgi:hypothetical protein
LIEKALKTTFTIKHEQRKHLYISFHDLERSPSPEYKDFLPPIIQVIILIETTPSEIKGDDVFVEWVIDVFKKLDSAKLQNSFSDMLFFSQLAWLYLLITISVYLTTLFSNFDEDVGRRTQSQGQSQSQRKITVRSIKNES